MLEALKKNRHIPSPDRYDPHIQKAVKGGIMRSKLKTDFSLK